MSIRNIQVQYRGSYLGVFWTILSPVLMLGIYTFVFGYVFGGSFGNETPAEHALGIFIGLAVHNFTAEMIVTSPSLIASNATLVKKVVFPLEVLVAARLVASLLTLSIKLFLILIASLYLTKTMSPNYLAILLLLALLVVIGFGLGTIFSSVGVFVKDLGNASQFLSMALLFGSAVFYPVSKIPDDAWTFLQINPLVFIIDGIRNIILWDTPVSAAYLVAPTIAAAVLFVLGNSCFQKLRPYFSDVI